MGDVVLEAVPDISESKAASSVSKTRLAGRLPGIGSSGRRAVVCMTASRLCESTLEVSQESNPSPWLKLSMDDRIECESLTSGALDDRKVSSLVFEAIGRTTCWTDDRRDGKEVLELFVKVGDGIGSL